MDYSLFIYINNLVGKWICLDSLAIFFANYFVYYLVAGALIVCFLIKTKREQIRYLFLVGASVILSRLVITELIRLIWHRSRPFVDYQVNQLIEHSASGSFPSGHVAGLFAIATAVYFFNKKFGIAFFIISFFIGLARVFVGIHYPLDILGGIVVGILGAVMVKFLIRKK
jgi:undecaprenyl-diphosphatase